MCKIKKLFFWVKVWTTIFRVLYTKIFRYDWQEYNHLVQSSCTVSMYLSFHILHHMEVESGFHHFRVNKRSSPLWVVESWWPCNPKEFTKSVSESPCPRPFGEYWISLRLVCHKLIWGLLKSNSPLEGILPLFYSDNRGSFLRRICRINWMWRRDCPWIWITFTL